MKPRVSVVMPVFNGGRYLRESIECVLAQTFTDLELLVVDDGSTDDSAEIASSFDDPRIRVVRRAHAGLAASENIGVSKARGPYIARLDADDLVAPTLIARQVAVLDSYADTACVGVWTRTFGTRLRVDRPPALPSDVKEALRRTWTLSQPTMYRASALRAVGGYRDGASEDWDLWIRLASRHDIRVIPEILGLIRAHPVSMTAQVSGTRDRLDQARMQIRAMRALGTDGRSIVYLLKGLVTLLPRALIRAVRSRSRQPDLVAPSTIGVVVPTLRRPALLARCLDALALQEDPPDEIVVALRDDDAETAGFLTNWIEQDPARHRTVTVDRPGQVPALIAGTAITSTEVVAYLDDDAAPDAGWIGELRRSFLDPRVGAAGGRIVDHVDGVPVVRHARRVGRVTWYGRVIFGLDAETEHYGPVDWLPGSNVAIRRGIAVHDRSLLQLHTGVEMYNDLDLCLQVRRAGYRVVYSPFAVVTHDTTSYRDPEVGGRANAADVEPTAADRIYVLAKHLSMPRRVALYAYMGIIGTSTVPAIGRVVLGAFRDRTSARAMARRLGSARQGRRRGRVLYRAYRRNATVSP